MRKIILIVLSIVLYLCGCNGEYDKNWKTVSFGNDSRLKIPSEWEIKEEGNCYILYDNNKVVKFIGYCSDEYDEEKWVDLETEGFEIKIENKEHYSNCASYSNSAGWVELSIICNGKEMKNTYSINTYDGENSFEFVCVNKENISEELIVKIAKGYEIGGE